MKFGGHETFAVREDWLPKGLRLVKDEPAAFDDPFVSDQLGVGRNMAKSIRHWLSATGLITRQSRANPLEMTPVAKVILAKDEYFLKSGTWWALHANLASSKDDAVAWHWFFNRFVADRFDRYRCVAELTRWAKNDLSRMPSPQTLARDVACMLSSYAPMDAHADNDPENGSYSPFRSLGLVEYRRESDVYQLHRRARKIPSEILGYVFSLASEDGEKAAGFHDFSLVQALANANSPGRILALNMEGLSDLLSHAEDKLGKKYVRTSMLGGERSVQVKRQAPVDWLKLYYRNAQH